jgi:hypothetical protein
MRPTEGSGSVTKTFAPTTVIIAFMTSGCIVMSSYQSGESLQEKQIQQIAPGTTTKQQILDLFGPPVAVARKGSAQMVPSAYQGIQVDTFFELFSPKHTLTERHIVYYYPAREVKGTSVLVPFAGAANNQVATDRLWILIDDGTGIVADYVFRKAQ